ncbi:hypothetical protein N7E02_26855 [Aliirhizobium terrae]|uniref:hypothetical protein n=1 Tax=Terrirhizobium terrae TaxID=2926709 RepID=UPI0025749682|nr:hypothetical protein [Rhizobium sp. CC-CFT758]WJH40196.1 hypothetical protein N7E02_26855 [Rhizobium sp. CC-CFT758]
MPTIRIYGIYDAKMRELVVDLRHLLRVLAPRSVQAMWSVSAVKSSEPGRQWFDATGEGGEELETLARDNAQVSGPVLAALAEATDQVIWGEFTGRFPAETDRDWITIRAVDSSFYEVTTLDDTAIGKIKAAFKDVRSATAPFA